ncbi:MAG: hypothetical protein HEEMFOPI_00220 [Holosporales bacterium]
MNKLILTFVTTTLALAYAKPYVALKTGYSRSNAKFEFNNIIDSIGSINRNLYPVYDQKNKNAFLFGAFCGYRFLNKSIHTPFVEGDVEFSNLSAKSNEIDTYDGLNTFENEHIDLKKKASFGFTVGLSEKLSEKWSALLAVRLNATQYKVDAYHVNHSGSQDAENYHTKNVWILGVEPTLGAEYNHSKKLSTRVTVGYNIQKAKQVFSNYIGDPTLVNGGLSIGAKISEPSVNIRASIIYTF